MHQILKLLSKIMYIKCLAHDLIHNRSMKNVSIKNHFSGVSRVAQWLRICLPMQGTQV